VEETSIFIEAFKQLPVYLSTFGKLISSPIKFIKQEVDDESTDSLAKALMFVSVSTLIVITSAYLLQGVSFSVVLAHYTLISILDIIGTFFVFSIPFKMIEASVNQQMILIAVLYYVGILEFSGNYPVDKTWC